MMREAFAIDIDRDRADFVFAGDSPNDQPMFAFFPNAVGVANVLEMADLMTDFPAWITPSAGAAGVPGPGGGPRPPPGRVAPPGGGAQPPPHQPPAAQPTPRPPPPPHPGPRAPPPAPRRD